LKKIDQRGQEEVVGLGVGGGRRNITGEEGGDRRVHELARHRRLDILIKKLSYITNSSCSKEYMKRQHQTP
jgi:hypothetical protein